MPIVVTTPTGQIGRRVVERLLGAGADVAVVVRDPARLAPDVRARVAVHAGSLEHAAVVREATRGARALFLLVPPHLGTDDWAGFQRRVGRIAADAVRANGVERVVFLSSVGAHRDDLYAVSRLGEIERMLAAAAPHVASLRAGFFFENFLAAAGSVAADGAVYMTAPPDHRIPMVAARDIADVAADLLLDDGWRGHVVRGVHGPADLSYAEATAAIARAVGRPVRYVQVSYDALREALRAAGASEHVAAEYPRLVAASDAERIAGEPRTPATTTPTTIDQWAREAFAPAGTPAEAVAAP